MLRKEKTNINALSGIQTRGLFTLSRPTPQTPWPPNLIIYIVCLFFFSLHSSLCIVRRKHSFYIFILCQMKPDLYGTTVDYASWLVNICKPITDVGSSLGLGCCSRALHGALLPYKFNSNISSATICIDYKLQTLWCMIFIEKLIITYLVKKCFSFMASQDK